VRNSSKTQDLVLDPFGGSGTTVIACEKTNRRARVIELDPKYVDVIVKRWEDYAGKQAVQISNQETSIVSVSPESVPFCGVKVHGSKDFK
jgi:DNA modification methylase